MMKTRREFLLSVAGMSVIPVLPDTPPESGKVMTVNGWVDVSEIAYALPHEHVMVDFIGAGEAGRNRYDINEVFDRAKPELIRLKQTGCSLLMECTPAYLGRDVKLLKRLSAASGMMIATNTGYYGASKEKYFPRQVYDLSAEALAAIWIREFTSGIDGSEVRPGFIKLGVDNAPLSEAQRKTIRAGALTHLATGLAIGIHTGNGAAAEEELQILEENGVAPEAFVWIHAQNEKDFSYFSKLARKGAWIESDNISSDRLNDNLRFLQYMKSEDLLDKTLLSQDSGWYHVGEKNGGQFNGYTFLFTDFIPFLRKNGFTPGEVDQVFKHNLRKALAVRIRKSVNT
jgi:phosphotriesterase-related protein